MLLKFEKGAVSMKRVFSLMLLFLPVFAIAAPWGVPTDYTHTWDPSSPSSRPGEKYLLPRILDGQTVRIYLDFPNGNEKQRAAAQKSIADSYARWFAEPAKIIRQTGREAEFADILKILDRGIRVQFVGVDQPRDLDFCIASRSQLAGTGAAGWYERNDEDGGAPRIVRLMDTAGNRIMGMDAEIVQLHEIGHSLGLSDQYDFWRDEGTHAVYHSKPQADGIMKQYPVISCDEADGIVNLIDLTRRVRRGGERGWRSLCKGSDQYYINAMPAGRGPYAISFSSELDWMLETFRDGKKVQEQKLTLDLKNGLSPFDEGPERVLERDAAGRPVRAQGSQGEDIFYSYTYDKRMRLVLRDGRLVQSEETKPVRAGNGQVMQRTVFFGEDGEFSVVIMSRAKWQQPKGWAAYETQFGEEMASVSLQIHFNAKGQVSKHSIYVADEVRAASSGSKKEQALEQALSQSMQQQKWQRKLEELSEWYLKQH